MFITGSDDNNNNDNMNDDDDNTIPTGPFRFHQQKNKSNNNNNNLQRMNSNGSNTARDNNDDNNDGRWSPPPPLDRNNKQSSKRSSSVGINQSRSTNNTNNNSDLPPWERRVPSNNNNKGNNNNNLGSLPSNNNKKGIPTKSILPSSGNSANAVLNSKDNNNKNKIILKAPLPPQAKRTNSNNTSSTSSSNKNNKGSGSSGGGARLPVSSDNENNQDNDSEEIEPERPKYSDLHRNTPDFELIDRLEREILDLAPNIRWSDIAGLDDAKGVLQEAVVLPIMCPGFFSGIRKPWKGVLLYGPPGTGKTLLAKAVATECRTTFFNVSASSLASKWRGDGEKMVRILFDMAKHYAPAVVFFDEVDSIATKRTEGEQEASRRMKTEMLVRMDGISNSNSDAASDATNNNNTDDNEETTDTSAAKMVMVLGATNQPWELDDAFKRRFEKRIYIPLPGIEERIALFRICLKDIKLAEDVNLRTLAQLTDHYSGADIAVVCKHAAYCPMRQKQAEVAKAFPRSDQIRERIEAIKASENEVRNAPITLRNFEEAITSNKPSASNANLKQFEIYAAEHGAT